MNVLRGDVDLTQDQAAFATGAEQVNGDSITFFLQAPVVHPVLLTAVSQKTHTGAGDWAIDVGAGDIESRSSQLGTANPNEVTIVATFDMPIGLLGGADVLADIGTVSNVSQTDVSEATVTVSGLAMNTQVNLSFPGVVDVNTFNPASGSLSTLCVRIIVGDYDNLGRTNFLDYSKIQAAGYLNQLVTTVDIARADYDCNGRPTFLDFSKVKNAGLINQTAPECATSIGP
jgi:hypothetical protein